MNSLLALAARVEAATGPDRELDALVHCAIKGWEAVYEGTDVLAIVDGKRVMVGWIDPGQHSRNFTALTDSLSPFYTSSLDAAMTLVPKTACNHALHSFIGHGNKSWGEFGWFFRFMDRAQLMGRSAAKEQIARLRRDHPIGREICGPARVEMEKAIAEHYREFFCRGAAAPALAVVSACLRALGEQANRDGGRIMGAYDTRGGTPQHDPMFDLDDTTLLQDDILERLELWGVDAPVCDRIVQLLAEWEKGQANTEEGEKG